MELRRPRLRAAGRCRPSREHVRKSTTGVFANDVENPFTTPPTKPFVWVRVRAVGGRSLVWGRQSYRLSDLDFKAASRDGIGVDWPVNHTEMAPYYAKVERFIGISGRAEGLSHFPDGEFLPPMEFNCGERVLKESVERSFGKAGHDRPVSGSDIAAAWPGRLSLLRPVQSRVRDLLLLLKPVHHACRGQPDGAPDGRPGRRRVPCDHR